MSWTRWLCYQLCQLGEYKFNIDLITYFLHYLAETADKQASSSSALRMNFYLLFLIVDSSNFVDSITDFSFYFLKYCLQNFWILALVN